MIGNNPTKVVFIMSEKTRLIVFCISNIALCIWIFYGLILFKNWLREVLGINEIIKEIEEKRSNNRG